MSRTLNIVVTFAIVAASSVFALELLGHLGTEAVRTGLRWAFGPATVLVGFASTMIGKVHDLAELKGVTAAVVSRLQEKIRIVQIRLWVQIAPVLIASMAGLFLSFLPQQFATSAWVEIITAVTVTVLLSTFVFALAYLPMLQSDYTQFRLRVARDAKEKEERDELLKAMKDAEK